MSGHHTRSANYGRTLESLNAVTLTIDQIERGYIAFVGGCSDPFDAAFDEKRMMALRLFCWQEGLRPAECAADAILLRHRTISDAWMTGINLKAEDPERYARLATDPIDPLLLAFLPESAVGDRELLPILQ